MGRDRRIDGMRGLAIVSIVAAHAVMAYRGIHFQPQALLGGTHFVRPFGPEALAVDLAYAIGLPLFGFVTGLTLLKTSRRGWDLVRSRAVSLLVPYLSWLALGSGLVAYRSGPAAAVGNAMAGIVSAGGRGSLWFLYALFVCVCVFAACRTDRALVVTATLAPLVMAALAWESVDVLELRDAAWLYAPLVAGYLIAKHQPARLHLPSAALVVLGLPFVAQVSPWGLPFAALPTVPAQLLFSVVRVVVAVAGSALVYALARGAMSLASMGRRTLGIYAIHPLIIGVLNHRLPAAPWLTALVALLGAAAITIAIERVPLGRFLLLGGRAPGWASPKLVAEGPA